MKVVKAVSLVLIPALILILLWEIPRLIKIRSIGCTSQFGPCPKTVEEELKKNEGRNLVEVKRAIKNLLQKGEVTQFSLQYQLPDTLKLSILLRKPKFALREPDGEYMLVDKEGEVLAETTGSVLPSITGEVPKAAIGQKIDTETLFALDLVYNLNSLYQIESGTMSEGGLTVNLPERVTVVFPLKGDIRALLGSLSLILSSAASGKAGLQVGGRIIDLRFKNPVIK